MTIKNDFASYLDGNGLLSPSPITSGVLRGSDNGPMFTSEFYIILDKNKALDSKDVKTYTAKIADCISGNELSRAPGDTTLDAPDDYYGVYSGFVTLGIKPTFNLPVSLYRQPQLLFAALCANYGRVALLAFPLTIYTALVIATANMLDPPEESNNRRLAWHLIQATAPFSMLCKLASKLWYRRLRKNYPNGMKDVAALYYLPHGLNNNPYSTYWID